jgi:hypothetical protein
VPAHPASLGPRDLTLHSGGLAYGRWELDVEPRLWQLAAEDSAWSIAITDWQARRPSRLRLLAFARWRQEGSRHRVAGDQLHATARRLGLRAPALPGSPVGALMQGRSC